MDASGKLQIGATPPRRDFGDSALGLICTRSFPAIVGTADMMLKSSGVTLIGYEKTGSGYCTAVVRGGISDVRIAVDVGEDTARRFDQFISKTIIARPSPNLEAVLPIGSRLAKFLSDRGYSRLSKQAVGLLETRGYPAMVGAADAMLKAAEVQLAACETIGDGLCTAIIRGRVADVAMAVEAGMHEAERIGELHAVMVIPRPLDDLEETLPLASYWIEKPQPIALPLDLKAPQKELAEPEQPEVEVQRSQETLEPLEMVERSPQPAAPTPAPIPLPELEPLADPAPQPLEKLED
ncbi:MAG: BMC domain-containing protein [Elainellaceae cyanobacterium]